MHAASQPVIIPNFPTDYRTEYKDSYLADDINPQPESGTIKHLSGKMYPPLFKRHNGMDGDARYQW